MEQLEKNRIYPAVFEGYTSEGFGVCRILGRAVFVKGAMAGESGRVKILKVTASAAWGRLEALDAPSPHRVAPACPYAGRCGGCAFWHMDYDEELRLKAQRVQDALNRIGGCAFDRVPVLGAASAEGYRNKAQYPVAAVDGRPAAGFFRARSHQLIPISRCAIQAPAADAVKDVVLRWMTDHNVAPYDESSHSGTVRHIFVRHGFATGQLLVCLVLRGRSAPRSDLLPRYLLEAAPNLTTVVLNFNDRPGNAILGPEFKTIYGPGYIEDELCGLTFRLSPRSFYQVNRAQAQRLYGEAIARAQLTGTETVLDLYCGTGTITLAMAAHAGRVIGVEVIPQAIDDARENAVRNGIGNAEFFCADAGQAAARLAAEGIRPDVITVDPPRKGLSPEVIEATAAMAPRRVVYVSCDPATLARDVALFRGFGYEAADPVALDLFPRCAHVETVVALTRV